MTIVQEELAGRLLRDVARLLASDGGSIDSADGGRFRLKSALAQARMDRYLEPGAEPLSTVAEKVELDCVAVPKIAGVVDPLELPCLAEERRSILANAHSTVLPMSQWPNPLPKACHLIDPEDEVELARRCLQNGMAVLIRDEDVPLDAEGRPLVGGWFGVKHRPKNGRRRQRLIFDRRPQNAGEVPFGWAALPHGSQLCRQILEDYEGTRGSGDDLENYFYQVKHAQGWSSRNVVGRSMRAEVFRDLPGYETLPAGTYRLALQVVGMGDGRGVDVAQVVHEAILEEGGCMRPQEALKYKLDAPVSSCWEGVYIDDHLITQRLPLSCMKCVRHVNECACCARRPGPWRDQEIVESSERVYED